MKRKLKRPYKSKTEGIICEYSQRHCQAGAQYFFHGRHLCAYHTPIGYRQLKHRIDIPLEKQT